MLNCLGEPSLEVLVDLIPTHHESVGVDLAPRFVQSLFDDLA